MIDENLFSKIIPTSSRERDFAILFVSSLEIATWKFKVEFKTLSNFYDRKFLNISKKKRSIVDIWQSPKDGAALKTGDVAQDFNCARI